MRIKSLHTEFGLFREIRNLPKNPDDLLLDDEHRPSD